MIDIFYMNVYASSKGNVEALCVIKDRPIKATCYNQAYNKAMQIMRDNKFRMDNVFLVIETIPY